MSVLSSRDNPKVRHWAKLAEDGRYRREKRRALIEGPHLLAAALESGHKPVAVLISEPMDSETGTLVARSGVTPVTLARGLFRSIVDAETPQGVAAEIAIPEAAARPGDAVFLEGLQDPANVGAIIRSAAAFGVAQVVLDKACADPWSPKALRAGQGGHFALAIRQTERLGQDLAAFKGTLICTVPRGGKPLSGAKLTPPLGWLFGGEGAGLSEETLRRVLLSVTIPVKAGTESLNVAATAAICLHEGFSRSAAGS
jgi:TrmH family RNA methyltransferase